MKSFFIKILSLIIVLGFSITTYADTRINQVWTCTVKDGKTIDDIKKLNHKWVKYVNTAVKGGDIQSYVATAIIGNLGTFIFVDSFPNMNSWTAKEAAMKTDEGKKIDDGFAELGDCQSNSLYSVEES